MTSSSKETRRRGEQKPLIVIERIIRYVGKLPKLILIVDILNSSGYIIIQPILSSIILSSPIILDENSQILLTFGDTSQHFHELSHLCVHLIHQMSSISAICSRICFICCLWLLRVERVSQIGPHDN